MFDIFLKCPTYFRCSFLCIKTSVSFLLLLLNHLSSTVKLVIFLIEEKMDHLKGQTLVNKNKAKVSADDALKDKEIIAFYFSAHWCPPCRMFTPVLADFYEEVTNQGSPFEVIFISSDRSDEALFDYMIEAHGDWLAVPFNSPVNEKLKQQFNIQGIPSLIVVKKDGTVVSTNGRSDVERKGSNAFKDWCK